VGARGLELPGAVVLVTGAGRGIGRATARALAAAGARVVCAGRDPAATGAVAAEVRGRAVVADLRDPAAPGRLVAAALEQHGRLDAVVANAGVGAAGPVAAMEPALLAEVVDVDLRAALLLARAAAAAMTDRGRGGAVVFVTSIAGLVGVPGESVYSAVKAGLEAFAPLLAEELRGAGVRVSTVAPGVVDTGFFDARGVPYARRFPRPVPAERVAAAVLEVLRTGRPRRVEPRWLAVPARLAAVAPRTFRVLARRAG
jgi:NAD(P)-dependent dehydrogenase (short-subunit alcohol dehydrogenase family)